MTAAAQTTPLLKDVEARLLVPGSPFEIAEANVLGESMRVFKNRARSLRDVLISARQHEHNEYLAFTDGETERRFTYADHERLVASTAKVLAESYGVGPGDRVAILAANCPEWIVTFWATVSLGAIAVGLNAWWTGEEIRYGLAHSEPKVLIGDRKRLARLGDAKVDVPTVAIEGQFEDVWGAHPDAALPEPTIEEHDRAVILYTSGTTGRAKGVVHTHGNITNMILVSFFHGARLAMTAGAGPPLPPSVLVTSPLFHVSGLHCAAITGLAAGAKTVWPIGRFDPVLALRLIEKEKITGWGYTSTILHRLVNHPEAAKRDLSSFRMIGGGGSAIPVTLQRRTLELVPQCKASMGVGYGLTEGTAFTTLNPGRELGEHPTAAGRPVPIVDVEIRDADGKCLPDGTDGDIYMRGPLVMLEYWRDPEATTEVIKKGRWLKTGDIGHLEDGRLYLASRKRDLIIRGGENIYPFEIEQRLEEHSLVAEAAVIGVDSDEFGQEVKAVVVPAPDESPTTDQLHQWCQRTLAYYKVPTYWDLRRAPLPRNATGKVLKDQLSMPTASRFIEE